MQSTTIRIRKQTRQVLRDLAAQENIPMQAVLDEAIETYRRQRFLRAVNRAYHTLKQDPQSWQQLEHERQEWDATLNDGLQDAATGTNGCTAD